MLLLVWSG
ncbi:hypothetical protein CGLO_15383 [Colletotrichum gloeosporioides Cg-14]|uniref:Uncharacterized protein n=1 Tax=Colletotrichum gloeosporioides (strain Cg-14) TaxID=1237896 RepID=T0JZ07_COLGC|nr:hypothetical protein CGLO_15383 [Colletotrichum gloeosporioides Cg-14]